MARPTAQTRTADPAVAKVLEDLRTHQPTPAPAFGKPSAFSAAAFGPAKAFGGAAFSSAAPPAFGGGRGGGRGGRAGARGAFTPPPERPKRNRNPQHHDRRILLVPPAVKKRTSSRLWQRAVGCWAMPHRDIIELDNRCAGDYCYGDGDGWDFDGLTEGRREVRIGHWGWELEHGWSCDFREEEFDGYEFPCDCGLEPFEAMWLDPEDVPWCHADDLDLYRGSFGYPSTDGVSEDATQWERIWQMACELRPQAIADPAKVLEAVAAIEAQMPYFQQGCAAETARSAMLAIGLPISLSRARGDSGDELNRAFMMRIEDGDEQLLDAFADYVVFTRAQALGGDGEKLRALLDQCHDEDWIPYHPDELTYLVWEPDDQPEQTAGRGVIPVWGKQMVVETSYFSAFNYESFGQVERPNWLYGWRECLTTPVGREQWGECAPLVPKRLRGYLQRYG